MDSNFDDLLKDIRHCNLCESELPLGPRPIFQIDPAAKILVVGQAPGIRVHQTGIAFNDPSGDRLRQWMNISKEVFYDKKKIAIIPMGFCYPGTGKNGDLPPHSRCAKQWREALLTKLPNIELTLAIGRYAIHYHLQNVKGQSLTQIVQEGENYGSIFPLPHPSPRNNIWLKKNPWFENRVISRLQEEVSKVHFT